jgi:hypothetical protein
MIGALREFFTGKALGRPKLFPLTIAGANRSAGRVAAADK